MDGGEADGTEVEFDIKDPSHVEHLFQYAMEKMEKIPMRAPKLKGLAKQMAEQAAEERRLSGEVDLDEEEQHPSAKIFEVIEHYHFQPPDRRRRHGEYQPSFVDALLSHHEEDAPTLDPPPPPLSTVAEWLDALELPGGSPMRQNAKFLWVLTELSEPKYSPEQKQAFVKHLTEGLMVDPERAGYVGREPRVGIPANPAGGLPPSQVLIRTRGGTRLQNALEQKRKQTVSYVPVPQEEHQQSA